MNSRNINNINYIYLLNKNRYLILQNDYYEKLLNMMFEHTKYTLDISDVIRECQRQWDLVLQN